MNRAGDQQTDGGIARHANLPPGTRHHARQRRLPYAHRNTVGSAVYAVAAAASRLRPRVSRANQSVMLAASNWVPPISSHT